MLMHSKSLNLVLIALTLTLTCSTQAADATKLNAKPLPKKSDSDQTGWNRGEKDFDNDAQYHAPQLSRFKRRPDYRDLEKQQKEEEAKKAADALEAKKAAEAARAEHDKKHHATLAKYKADAIEYNNQGVAFGSQGKWVDAIAMHEKAVQYDPHHKQYKLNLSAARTAFAEVKMKQGDSAGAAVLYRKALFAEYANARAVKGLSAALEKQAIDPVDLEARIALGDQLINTGDLEGAFVEYKQALEIDPSSAKVLVKFGDLQYRWGQVGQALQCYQQAAVKDPNYGPAQRQLGIMKLLQKDETGAAALLRKALILDDSDALAGQHLTEIWRKQVAKNPLNPDFHLGLAGALQLTGDYAGAEAEYKKLEMLNANHPGLADGRASLQKAYQHGRAEKHKKAADTLFSQGLRKEALAEVSQAVMIEPRNARYQFLLGECLEGIGDYKGAHQAYLTCVLINPDSEKGKEAAARMKEMQSQSPVPAQPTVGSFTPPAQQPVNPLMPQRQGMPPQGMSQGMPPQGMPPQGMSPQGMSQGMPPQGMPQQGMNPGMPPPGMPPQNMQGMPMNMQTPMRFPAQQPMTVGMPPQNLMQQPGGMPGANNFAAMPPQNAPLANGVFEGAPGMAAAPTSASFRPQTGFLQNQVATQPVPTQQIGQAMGAQNGVRNSPTGQVDSTIYGGGSANDNVNVPTGTGSATTQEDPKLAEVTQAESRRDYMAAVAILRDVVATDLENASNHHRLAVNLMAAGRISEAVTEFRIASALKPGTKTYADDLARALSTHKRSMMSNNDGTTANTEEKGGN